MHPLIRQASLIGGEWVEHPDTQPVYDPYSDEVLAHVPQLSQREIEHAIHCAENALPAWRARLASERANILRRWHDLIVQQRDALAELMTREQGKPLAEARGEVLYGASFVDWFAEEARRVYGETIPAHQSGKRLLVLREPIGVCAAITPWNFPIAMITRKVAPALAAGCTIIVKPAPQTPLCALALGELALQAGIPPGVLNIVTGDAQTIGDVLCASPTVRKLSFTGSTEVGRLLMRQSADTLKRLSLELGGNAPFIVFDDADPDIALAALMQSKYRNSGQTCVSTNRVFVQRGLYNALAERLQQASAALVLGSGLDANTEQGPLIDDAAVEKVEQHVHSAVADGAKVLCGGQRHALGGRFFAPTVLTDVTPQMNIAREETFGPVAPLIPFDNEEDVITWANATPYGLAGYFCTRDLHRTWRVAEALEFGMIGINTGHLSTTVAPFGGIKASGLGREGSRHGIDEYLELKYLCMA